MSIPGPKRALTYPIFMSSALEQCFGRQPQGNIFKKRRRIFHAAAVEK